MVTLRRRVAVAVLLALATAGCGADKQETPPTSATTARPTTTTTPPPPPSAPRVAAPLSADEFIANPCSSLTGAQQHDYGVVRAERSTLATEGESCFFVRATEGDAVFVAFAGNIRIGLDSRYNEHNSGMWVFWSETEIAGYPAVMFGTSEELDCNVGVGISDSLYFWVAHTAPTTAARCVTAKAVAATILANIKQDN